MAELTLSDGKRVFFAERPDSPQESYAGGVAKVKRIFDVRWADRLKFLSGMLGFSEPVYSNTGVFRYVKRVPPVPYPPLEVPTNKAGFIGVREADDHFLYATSVDHIEPIGIDRTRVNERTVPGKKEYELSAEVKDDQDVFKHAYARITIGYEALPYRVTSDQSMKSLGFVTSGDPDESFFWRYVSRTVQPHAEHLTLPFGVLKWDSSAPGGLASKVATNQTGRIIPTLEFVWTWHQVPGFPEQAFTMIGSINSVALTDYSPGASRAWSYAAGTLLFTGMELKTYRMSTGIYCNDVVYRMKYFSAIEPHTGTFYSPDRGHNYFLAFHNPVGTPPNDYSYSYQKLVDGTGTRGVYQEADLRKLFTLPNLT